MQATQSLDSLQRHATKAVKSFGFQARDLRGIGIYVSKLEAKTDLKGVTSMFLGLAKDQKTCANKHAEMDRKDIDMSVFHLLPKEIQQEYNDYFRNEQEHKEGRSEEKRPEKSRDVDRQNDNLESHKHQLLGPAIQNPNLIVIRQRPKYQGKLQLDDLKQELFLAKNIDQQSVLEYCTALLNGKYFAEAASLSRFLNRISSSKEKQWETTANQAMNLLNNRVYEKNREDSSK